MKNTLSARVRFGTFELHLRSGELRPAAEPPEGDGGSNIVLGEQSLQVLRMLIERDGEIATREEIKKKLWPNDTIVEFDHSINVAIGKLRKALGDSADEPKYIGTVASRGYRLMVPVEWMVADDVPASRMRKTLGDASRGDTHASPSRERSPAERCRITGS